MKFKFLTASLIMVLISCSDSSNNLSMEIDEPRPILDNIDTNSEIFYPKFDSQIYHYAAKCDSDITFSLNLFSDNQKESANCLSVLNIIRRNSIARLFTS